MSDGNISNRGPAPAPVSPGTPGAPPSPDAPAGPPGAPPPTESVSPRLAALMRKEAHAAKQLIEAKAIQEQAKKDRAAWESERAQYGEFDKRWRENPLEALKSRGVSIDDLARIAGNQGQMTPELQLRAQNQELTDRIKSLEGQINDRFSKLDEGEKTRAETAVKEAEDAMRNDIRQTLETAAEKFPLTKMFARDDLVYTIIEAHYEKTQEVLDVETAAEQVEKMLLDEALKVQPILDKHRQPPAPTQGTPPPGSLREQARMLAGSRETWVERAPKTLSNDLPQSMPSAPRRLLTEEERVNNALAKLRAARP